MVHMLERRRARAATPPSIATVEAKLPERAKTRRARAAKPAAGIDAAMARATALATAPLRLFELSDLNVRKTYRPAEIEELARDLALRGMKQNLVAVPSPNGGGKLAVVAGGRRLRALWWLLDQGKLTLDHEVIYQLENTESGRETSLAENVQKVALNPADEFEAYAQIVADHADQPDPVGYCARRQGASRAHVERMLRLADLAPEILDALREGRIDVGAAQAYGATSDHDAQLAVFAAEERREFGQRHAARTVRESLRGRSYPAGVPQALYVGLTAYLAAGGRVDRELFFGDDTGERLLDTVLLDQLARAKAVAELPALAAGDGFASGVLTNGFNPVPSWPKPPPTHVQRQGYRPDQLAADMRAASIGVYNLAADGSGLELAGVMTPIAMPATAPAPAAIRDAAGDVASVHEQPARPAEPPIGALPIRRGPETAEQCIARLRDQAIQRRAAALAARALAVAALSYDRVVQPGIDDDTDQPVEMADDGDIIVTIQVRVHPAELEAQRATAAAELDEEERGGGVEARQPLSEAA